jgi:DNA-binding NtrC family response regulator
MHPFLGSEIAWRFSDSLPPIAPKPGSSKSGLGKTRNLRRVFVIDDEELIADSLVEILNGHGFDAVAFYTGTDAIESAREDCPDIVLSDVLMPRLNGVDTAIRIREHCPHVRILLFSGQAGTANIVEQARSRGHLFELLPKPLHPDVVLRELRKRE